MRRLLVTVGVLLVFLLLYLVLDVVAKGFVERRVEDEFVNSDRVEVEDASFVIDSFPFLGRLGAYGEVSATLELDGVLERGVTVDRFRLEVDGLVFDRVSAFNGHVEVTDIDEATTSISLSESTIAALVGVPVDVAADGTVTAGGVTVQAAMAGDDLVLEGGGAGPVVVPLRLGRFMNCAPTVVVADQQVTLTCVTDTLPPIVNRVLGAASRRARV
ncbi:MAG TPA: hypothetical protein VID94_00105 [Acidimicrobiales bacterium]